MDMKQQNNMAIGRKWGLMTLLLALSFCLMAGSVMAQVDCNNPGDTDSDGDGLTDVQECNGIVLTGDIQVTNLDPDRRDLFVILKKATTGSILATIEFDPFATLRDLVNVHEISESQLDVNGTVNGTQHAAILLEKPAEGAGGGYFGEMPWGTPNQGNVGQVYTGDIHNFVYGLGGSDADFAAYVQYVIAHEHGHGLKLTPTLISRYDGYHYATRKKVVMSESATVSTKKGVSFTIPATWHADSPGNAIVSE